MKYFDKDKAIEEINELLIDLYYDKVLDRGKIIGLTDALKIIDNNIHSKPKTKSAAEYKIHSSQYDFPIGTKVMIRGKKGKVILKDVETCSFCINKDYPRDFCERFACLRIERKDKTPIIFKEI